MTRAGTVRFEKDEPVCMVFPVSKSVLQATQPEIIELDAAPEVKAQTMAWKERRDEFMKKFHANDPATLKEAWQRFYFVGKLPDGSSPETEHVHKLKVAAPIDLRRAKKVTQG